MDSITTERKPLNLQQLFDNALNGIRGQGYRVSRVDDKPLASCAYRGTAGLKCAIGHSIPDDLYDPFWDQGGGVSSDMINGGIFVRTGIPLFETNHYTTYHARVLQQIHDGLDIGFYGLSEEFAMLQKKKKFEQLMKWFAEQYGLTYEPPKEG